MNYQIWKHREGSVIIEKYVGSVDIDQILSNDESALEDTPSGMGSIIVLTDISEATFPSVEIDKIGELFKVIDANISQSEGMKIALYTGNISYENFAKASSYARHGLKQSLSIVPFNTLSSAMNWLGLSPSEKAVISEQLKS